MKVCIIGAGLAGLSCAITLEKYGITPDIFDQIDRAGGMDPYVVCLLQIMNRPIPDPLMSLKKDYGISITPISVLDRIIRFSDKKISKSTGKLGYIFEISPSPRSINHGLYKKLKTPVHFNTVADYKALSHSYDKVVIATGTPYPAKDLGCWTKDIFRGWVRGAVAEGNFDKSTFIIWYNKNYSNNGYAYLAPFSSKKASLILVVSDVKEEQVESKWNAFLETEKISYSLRQDFIREHIAGFCSPREINNILLAGNSGGMLESVFGFGIYNAIASGVLAAKSIAENLSYESAVSKFDSKLYKSYLLRKKLDNFKNEDYNKIFQIFDLPLVNRMIYNTNIDVLSLHQKVSNLFMNQETD